MEIDSNNLPRPRLFQIVITGKRVSYDARGVAFETDHVVSLLQVVVDDADLEYTVEVFKEELSEVHSIKTNEIHMGYSPLFHDVIIEGCKALQLTRS